MTGNSSLDAQKDTTSLGVPLTSPLLSLLGARAPASIPRAVFWVRELMRRVSKGGEKEPCFPELDSIVQCMCHASMVSFVALPVRPTSVMGEGLCLRSALGSMLGSTHLPPYLQRPTCVMVELPFRVFLS